MDKNKKPRNRIAELRKDKGLTLQQVANKIGVGNNTISRYETGKRKPNEDVLTSLSSLFKVPVSYLVGNGWSQNDVIWFLIYIYVNRFNEDFELPSGIYSSNGRIEKYGSEKESFDDFNNEDIPGFIQKAKEYLIENKNDEITHDLIVNYYDGDEDVIVDDNDLDNYVDDEIDSLSEKYLSDSDLSIIRSQVLDELKNDEIDLPSILEKLISKNILNKLEILALENRPVSNHDDTDIDLHFLKKHISSNFFKEFKKEAISRINSLTDYVFLSNIGEDFYSTGIIPEYEIAKNISDDLKIKNFNNRQEYFEHDPYKASEEAISNLSMSASDKSSLIDIVHYLLNENEELKELIDELSNQINDSNDFNELSNHDYRGNR